MKTPIKELIDSVGNMAQGLDADELYDYFMQKATEMLEKEKEVIVNAYIDGLGLEPYEVYSKQQAKEYYN
jgi:HEPN domain-containing protein